MWEFLKKIISDENAIPSTKRILSISGTIAIIVYMFCFQSIDALDALTIIVLGSIGVTGAVSIFGNKNKL